MGESKRRKETDPNYGKPKDFDFKGIVLSPPLTIEGSMVSGGFNLHPDELRFALLFWDKLVWPSSRAVYFGSNEHEVYLEELGVLSRPEYTFNGAMSESILRSQIQAFLDLDKKEPGAWSFAQGVNSLIVKDMAFIEKVGTLSLELNRAIPIPAKDTPLAEILEFKEKRKDQLLILRAHLASIEKEICGSEEPSQALNDKVNEIDRACLELLKVSNEWRFPVVLSDLKVSVNLDPMNILKGAGAGWSLGKELGDTGAFVGAAFGGMSSLISAKYDSIAFRSIRRPASPYKYAYHINKELLF